MGTPRKTGDELFDRFWAAYPARNGRKTTKADCIKWFKTNKPTQEDIDGMVHWLQMDAKSRETLRTQNKFCPEPKDPIRFLRAEQWIHDEIGVIVTDSQRFEKKRSNHVQDRNIKDMIEHWSNVIQEWGVDQLKADSRFMAAAQYPEFAQWALKERPDLKGAKARKAMCSEPEPVKQPMTGRDKWMSTAGDLLKDVIDYKKSNNFTKNL